MSNNTKIFLLIAFIGILLVGFVGCGGDVTEKESAEEPEKVIEEEKTGIEGKWVGISEGTSQGWEFTFSGNKIDIKTPSEDVWYKGTTKLNEKVDPKTIDIIIKTASPEKYMGKTSLGIYKIEENTLTIAVNEPGTSDRPADFEPKKETVIIVLKK